MSSFHCQPVLERKHVFNWSMLLTAFVVRIPVGPWHLHLSPQTPLPRALRTYPGPLGNASWLVKPRCARWPLGWRCHKAPTLPRAPVGSWSQREGEDPLLKQKRNPSRKPIMQMMHSYKWLNYTRDPSKDFLPEVKPAFTPLSAALASQELNHREWPPWGVPRS